MQRIEYQELRGDKDLDYWIRYNMRFGHYHLINPSHRLGFREVYDLDIKFLMLLAVVLTLKTLKRLILG